MIIIKKINHNVAEHFDPNGNSLGFLNELEHLYLRAQIAKEKISGYYAIIPDEEYFKYNKEQPKYNILSDGMLEDWEKGFYSQAFELVKELVTINRKNKQ